MFQDAVFVPPNSLEEFGGTDIPGKQEIPAGISSQNWNCGIEGIWRNNVEFLRNGWNSLVGPPRNGIPGIVECAAKLPTELGRGPKN